MLDALAQPVRSLNTETSLCGGEGAEPKGFRILSPCSFSLNQSFGFPITGPFLFTCVLTFSTFSRGEFSVSLKWACVCLHPYLSFPFHLNYPFLSDFLRTKNSLWYPPPPPLPPTSLPLPDSQRGFQGHKRDFRDTSTACLPSAPPARPFGLCSGSDKEGLRGRSFAPRLCPHNRQPRPGKEITRRGG